eukprot:m.131490 g.131490  ORF g.131490 m.131490 type:complete len:314 (-) comp15745_c0_seq4:613-1554(-)
MGTQTTPVCSHRGTKKEREKWERKKSFQIRHDLHLCGSLGSIKALEKRRLLDTKLGLNFNTTGSNLTRNVEPAVALGLVHTTPDTKVFSHFVLVCFVQVSVGKELEHDKVGDRRGHGQESETRDNRCHEREKIKLAQFSRLDKNEANTMSIEDLSTLAVISIDCLLHFELGICKRTRLIRVAKRTAAYSLIVDVDNHVKAIVSDGGPRGCVLVHICIASLQQLAHTHNITTSRIALINRVWTAVIRPASNHFAGCQVFQRSVHCIVTCVGSRSGNDLTSDGMTNANCKIFCVGNIKRRMVANVAIAASIKEFS